MRMRLVIFALVLLPAAVASAQWGGGGYGYSYHSSTLEEGIQRGFADVVRSQGMANLYNAQAATEAEKARSAYLDNQYKATQTYFEMRRYNTEARRAERSSPLSSEQYVRLARVEAPDRLTPTQLDPLTGTVGWPEPLRRPEYDAYRKRLEKLLQDRTIGYVAYGEIQQAVQQFSDQLRSDLMKFPANDYIQAKKFLDSLAYAARGVQS